MCSFVIHASHFLRLHSQPTFTDITSRSSLAVTQRSNSKTRYKMFFLRPRLAHFALSTKTGSCLRNGYSKRISIRLSHDQLHEPVASMKLSMSSQDATRRTRTPNARRSPEQHEVIENFASYMQDTSPYRC